ncbi:MAG: DUF4202 domain-containing protein [Acidimicrobiales bacterium]|jgi:hypothetical protein|nr:DUF4202 domain-containing protein [Acidimicrobiales bacterium]
MPSAIPDPERFAAAIAAIDEANAEDPNVLVVDGTPRPKELVHAEAMTEWVRRLDPDADEVQLLAARAHHFRRWTYPRSSQPDGRQGYLRWRLEAKRRQAEAVGQLLGGLGYDEATIDGVRALVTKEGLGRGDLPDVGGRAPAVQTHEDALCLVFLTTQFHPVAEQLGDVKMIGVLERTLAKMGARGRAEALGLPLDDHAAALVLVAVERLLPLGAGADADEPVDAEESAPPTPEPERPPIAVAGGGEADTSAAIEDDGLDALLALPIEQLEEPDPEERTGPGPVGGPATVGGPASPPSLSLVPPEPAPGVEPVVEVEPALEVEPEPDTGVPRASTVRRAMMWGERPHPPPVNAPPPPLPLDAPRRPVASNVSTMAAAPVALPRLDEDPADTADTVVGDPAPAPPTKGRRWFGRGTAPEPAEPAPPPPFLEPPPPPAPVFEERPATADDVDYVVPPEEDLGALVVDPYGVEVAAARMSAGARRAGAVPLGILSTMLSEGEVVESVVAGEYQHHPAVVMLTTRRVLIANERRWAPDVRSVPIGPDVVVQGWQDDRRATLLFGSDGRGLVVSGIVDRPLARDLARRLRELVASAGGPPP